MKTKKIEFRKVRWEKHDCIYEGIVKVTGKKRVLAFMFVMPDGPGIPRKKDQAVSERTAKDFVTGYRFGEDYDAAWAKFLKADANYRVDQE